jgi:threonylcarbamoyladenosine tRNA methylthiotransferase MtaB
MQPATYKVVSCRPNLLVPAWASYNNAVPGYYLENFGCRATQSDGASLERQLQARGYNRCDSPGNADIVILNTCTVTAAADIDARSAIRRNHRANPNSKILVTGCYAQRAPEEIAGISGVSYVVGNSHKHLIPDIVSDFVPVLPANFVGLEKVQLSAPAFTVISDIFAHTELIAAPVFEGESMAEKTRPNLKVQDGCNNRCSFCIIPSVRGQSRSMKLDRVMEEANAMVAAGYREIVLSGINLGRWGRDFEGKQQSFESLLRALLEHTDVQKIRISSVEPMDWSDELIALVAGSSRIAKHAHLPLQSGSDHILRRMHRKYRPWHYAEKIRKLREAMPDAAIGADVMVGFPGETEELFEESRSFIEQLPFTYLHVFTYSSRPGTASASMADQVPVHIARERNRILRELAAAKNLDFRKTFVGRELDVITLHTGDGASTEALSDNYLKVRVAGRHGANKMMKVEVTETSDEGLVALARVARRL